jgi:hypothetical protein
MSKELRAGTHAGRLLKDITLGNGSAELAPRSVGEVSMSEACLGRSHCRAEQPIVRFPKAPANLPTHVHLYQRELLEILRIQSVEMFS